MKCVAGAGTLALIVDSQPYQHRAARTDLDLALAAAAMNFELEVYFLGAAVLHLAADRDVKPALLPAGYRAWSALPDLTGTRFLAERGWLDYCSDNGLELLPEVEGLGRGELKSRWRRCPGGGDCLHLVAGASAGALDRCLLLFGPGDAMLFLDGGVTHITNAGALPPEALAGAYWSGPDLAARALGGVARGAGASVVDDAALAGLLRRHDHCLTWK